MIQPQTKPRAPNIVVDGIRWHFAPHALSIIDPNSLCIADLLRSGQAAAVKDGPHRTVYRIQLPGVRVYYKRCKLMGIRGYLRQCLRPPKAKMEFDRAQKIRERGIATIEPLAWGVQTNRLIGESFLITRALPDSVPLGQLLGGGWRVEGGGIVPFFPSPSTLHSPHALRQRITSELGRFLAQLHEAGIAHPDLHAGNLLLTWEGDDRPRFYLIDLHDIEIGAPLSWKASRANLILLNRWAQLRTSHADRARFAHAYFAGRTTNSIDVLRAIRELELATAESNFNFWRGRDRRCLGTNRYFQRERSNVCSGYSVREIDRSFLARLMDDPDAPFRMPENIVLKNSRSSTVIELDVPSSGGPKRMIYKRFRRDRWYDRITGHFYLAPALRSWFMGHALRSRELPTPRPWLVLHRRRFGLLADEYLLCEKVHDARDLHSYLGTIRDKSQFHQRKWELIEKLASLLRALHERFLSHRDLKAANILVSDSTASGIEFSFIDLVGVRSTRPSFQKRIQNLTRLNASFLDHSEVTRTDKLRFLRTYLCWGLRGQANWKDWWNALSAATRTKRERNARRGRPLS
jgi:tRNA A-37 threonylcarbamoyl transferase component Bud32